MKLLYAVGLSLCALAPLQGMTDTMDQAVGNSGATTQPKVLTKIEEKAFGAQLTYLVALQIKLRSELSNLIKQHRKYEGKDAFFAHTDEVTRMVLQNLDGSVSDLQTLFSDLNTSKLAISPDLKKIISIVKASYDMSAQSEADYQHMHSYVSSLDKSAGNNNASTESASAKVPYSGNSIKERLDNLQKSIHERTSDAEGEFAELVAELTVQEKICIDSYLNLVEIYRKFKEMSHALEFSDNAYRGQIENKLHDLYHGQNSLVTTMKGALNMIFEKQRMKQELAQMALTDLQTIRSHRTIVRGEQPVQGYQQIS